MKLFLLALVLTATSSLAAPGPTDTLKEADGKMRTFARNPGATPAGFATLAQSYLDIPELTKRALSDVWPKMPEKKRTDFSKTMFAVLCSNYAARAIVEGKKENIIKFAAEEISGNEATVQSNIRVGESRNSIVFKLYRAPAGNWKIYDVITDDVSLLEGYRDEFRQVISKRGLDALLQSLKAKESQQTKDGSSC